MLNYGHGLHPLDMLFVSQGTTMTDKTHREGGNLVYRFNIIDKTFLYLVCRITLSEFAIHLIGIQAPDICFTVNVQMWLCIYQAE